MTAAPYGYCPQCGAPGIAREWRLGGNDRCEKGHDYPSLMSVTEKPAAPSSVAASIPLSTVVAFLRPRGALGVLEGAPFVGMVADAGNLQAIRLPEDLMKTYAALYLGDGEICPAAEGWAARVLAMAIADTATHLDFSSLSVAELLRRDRLLARWIWHDYPPRALSFRERPIIGAPPVTTAARLAAVLRYEMERVR